MDANDLFKKLTTGVKFNTKRFEKDAKRFCMIRKSQSSKSSNGLIEKNKEIPHDQEVEDIIKEQEASSDSENSAPDVENEQTLQLLGSITSESKAVNRKQKKLKRNKKSNTKIANLKQEQVNHFRNVNRIHALGTDIPNPVSSFESLKQSYEISERLFSNILSEGYEKPTPIQMQAIPVMIQGREVLACAPTGSGKTAAFLIPIIHHLKEPRKKSFRAVIVSPTRELARQIFRECSRLCAGTNLNIHFIDKGNKDSKYLTLESSKKFDILITTPNKLVYLINQESAVISLSNVEYLIVDEADKLFEVGKKGFREQLATIYKACDGNNVRRAMFSATYTHEVETWCKLNLDSVVTVSIGARNAATDLVDQQLLFVGDESGKLLAFRDLVIKGKLEPPVLVFVQTKDRAKELFSELIYDGINVDVIHAERSQQQRDNVVKSFRAGKIWVLIATELMGRGIDFKGVNLVINYDFPPTSISYIHRIGRTGRAGRPGKAITFFTEEDSKSLRSIAQVMKNAGCKVPKYMLNMKKPDRKEKRELAKKTPDRKRISTVPLYDIHKKKRKRQATEHSKQKKTE